MLRILSDDDGAFRVQLQESLSAVAACRGRSLQARRYLFVMADATYVKVREDRRVVAKALMVVMGLTVDGFKEIIGFDLADAETWKAFVRSFGSSASRVCAC